MGNTRLKQALIKYDGDAYPWYTGYVERNKYIFSAEFSVYDRYSPYPIHATLSHIIKYLE